MDFKWTSSDIKPDDDYTCLPPNKRLQINVPLTQIPCAEWQKMKFQQSLNARDKQNKHFPEVGLNASDAVAIGDINKVCPKKGNNVSGGVKLLFCFWILIWKCWLEIPCAATLGVKILNHSKVLWFLSWKSPPSIPGCGTSIDMEVKCPAKVWYL